MQLSYKKIWTITYPVLISLLMQDLIGMTDTAFLGRVGEIELGASALAGIYYLVIYMVGFGFGVGAEILMARRNGEKKYKSVGSIFFHGTILLMLMAVLMFLLSKFFSPGILRAFISSDAIYSATMDYVNWRIFGFFFSFIAIMFRAFYMSITKTKVLTINGIVMLLSNVVLNYALIFGKLGCPQMGIAGAAIGSTIAELISVIFFVIYTRLRIDYKKYGLFQLMPYSFKLQGRILKLSGFTTVQYFISMSTWFFFFMAIEHLGERSLAISNIVRNISALLYMVVSAFGSTGSALVSNLMGQGKQKEVMKLCGRIVKMCTLVNLPLFLFVIFFPELALRLYSDSPDLISSAIPSLYVMASSYIFAVPAYLLFFAISGTGSLKQAMIIEFSVLVVYISYIYIVAIRLSMDVAICWASDIVYSFLLLIISWIYLQKGSWRTRKI